MNKLLWVFGDVVSDVKQVGWRCLSVPEATWHRILSGERPLSWDLPFLPDFEQFTELAANTQLWQHITQHAETPSAMLFTALTARNPKISLVQGFMQHIVTVLGVAHALHTTPTLNEIGQPEPTISLADLLDNWLTQCHFGFTYADLTG